MAMQINMTTGIEAPASFIARSIIEKLNSGSRVLWFVTGGSSIAVAVAAAKIIREHPHQNLTVTLTDERYGLPDHPDSNWQQLLQQGFNLPQATLLPILTGGDIVTTTKNFDSILSDEFGKNSYKIGLFGIGADGHTAGIIPNTLAVSAPGWAFCYKAEKFERITMTPKSIMLLNEAVVFMQGMEKWKILDDLEKEIDIHLEPAQILKRVPLLTIFTDYIKS